MRLVVLNLVLPGSGLILRDLLAPGLAVLLVAVSAGAVAGLAGPLATPDFAVDLRLWAATAYAVLSLGSTGWLAYLVRHRRVDDGRVRSLQRDFVRAWLGGDDDGARTVARELARLAGHLPGAWRLRLLVATEEREIRRCRRSLAAALVRETVERGD